jgi:hypothetical protein
MIPGRALKGTDRDDAEPAQASVFRTNPRRYFLADVRIPAGIRIKKPLESEQSMEACLRSRCLARATKVAFRILQRIDSSRRTRCGRCP